MQGFKLHFSADFAHFVPRYRQTLCLKLFISVFFEHLVRSEKQHCRNELRYVPLYTFSMSFESFLISLLETISGQQLRESQLCYLLVF